VEVETTVIEHTRKAACDPDGKKINKKIKNFHSEVSCSPYNDRNPRQNDAVAVTAWSGALPLQKTQSVESTMQSLVARPLFSLCY